MQYLYWLYNPTTKLTKIGITDDYNRRVIQIENACGCDLTKIGIILSRFSDKAELLILQVLSEHKTRGEWFMLDKNNDCLNWLYDFFNGMSTVIEKDCLYVSKENFLLSYYGFSEF